MLVYIEVCMQQNFLAFINMSVFARFSGEYMCTLL